MNKLTTIGRILYAVPFAIFGMMHFMMGSAMAGMVPSFVPGGVFWVYLTGLALLAATVSIITKKQIVLTTLLLGALMFIFVLTIHLPALIGGDQMAMSSVLKDISLGGAALYLAGVYSKE